MRIIEEHRAATRRATGGPRSAYCSNDSFSVDASLPKGTREEIG